MIDDNTIFKKLVTKILLKLNKSLFLRNINKANELNHDEIVVAMGIIMKPIYLKK